MNLPFKRSQLKDYAGLLKTKYIMFNVTWIRSKCHERNAMQDGTQNHTNLIDMFIKKMMSILTKNNQ